MSDALTRIHDRFLEGFREHPFHERRIGAELKFPLVQQDGAAPPEHVVSAFWEYLAEQGWTLDHDSTANRPIGARRPGERNDTVASCETGYCKTEFSLAHVGNLFDLVKQVDELRILLEPFAEREGVRFLAYGIQPVSRPSKALLMKKKRTSMWDKVFPSNRVVLPEDGDDVHMFTVNASSHVHVSIAEEQAIPAVNVLNGFAGAQIALTADSSVWKGGKDPEYLCIDEKLWDWWPPAQDRAGVPRAPFKDSRDYVAAIARFKPVYVSRNGVPTTLKRYDSFLDYFGSETAMGEDLDGNDLPLSPAPEDIDIHNSCYWFTARVSRYFTVENRVADQQPPDALLTPAALTLGLVSALDEAAECLAAYDWDDLRQSRQIACRRAPGSEREEALLAKLKASLLELAELGLRRRGLGEEALLAPLQERYKANTCPAFDADRLFEEGGIGALLAARSL